MSCNTTLYKIGVRKVLFGSDKKEKNCISFVADVSSSLNEKYFVLTETNTAKTKHVFWYNVAGGGTAPTVPGATLHVIAIAANATAGAVCSASQAVIDALAMFVATIETDDLTHLTVENSSFGETYEARDAWAPADQTGFTFNRVVRGAIQIDLGATDGDVEFTIEKNTLEVNSPQTGDYTLDLVNRGFTGSCSFTLKDTSKTMITRLIQMEGSALVTDDADGKLIAGYGSKTLFRGASVTANVLTLRVPNGSVNDDYNLVKCLLSIDNPNFNSEDVETVSCTATPLLDETKDPKFNYIMHGDFSKVQSV